MRHLEFSDQAVECASFLERIQILALNVLDQRHGDRCLIGDAPHKRRDVVQSRELCRPPAPLTRDDFVAARWPAPRRR